MTFAETIKKHRLDNNWTEEELASILGITRMQVRNYESGKQTPTYKRLLKIGKILNIDLNALAITK